MKVRIKICGVRQAYEIQMLDELGVSYAGLWYGMPGGDYNLDIDSLVHLSAIPTRQLEFMLVTTLNDAEQLTDVLKTTGLSSVQLHGFQLPHFVRRLKMSCGDTVKVIKVLHIRENECVEEKFLQRYFEAGTDFFILDSYTESGRIGSSGIRISEEFLETFFQRWKRSGRFMLAGGIGKENIADICRRYRPYGIDIDTAAKCAKAIDRERVKDIMTAMTATESRIFC